MSFFPSFFFFVRLLQAPFPLSLYFLSLGLLSLHTSSRNAALMACMRSTGTLATLAHCFLICLFFWEEKSGERERVVSDGGSFFRRRVVAFLVSSHQRRPLIPSVPLQNFPFQDAQMAHLYVLSHFARQQRE